VSKPSDVKALVDAATKALKLIETIKNQSRGKVSREEIAADMARILDKVREARLRDIEVEFEKRLNERLKSMGIARGAAVDRVPVQPGLDLDPMAIELDEAQVGDVVQG
jgi:Fe2+ transport system protein FeoA